MKMHAVVLDGVVINIGPWQCEVPGRDAETGLPVVHDNPLPDGAVEGEFDIERAGEKFVLAGDYAALRRAEYPPVEEQLDALFHAGAFPPEMAARIAAVKTRHPKT